MLHGESALSQLIYSQTVIREMV